MRLGAELATATATQQVWSDADDERITLALAALGVVSEAQVAAMRAQARANWERWQELRRVWLAERGERLPTDPAEWYAQRHATVVTDDDGEAVQ